MKGYIKVTQQLTGKLSKPSASGDNSVQITDNVVLCCDGLALTTSVIGKSESGEENNGV